MALIVADGELKLIIKPEGRALEDIKIITAGRYLRAFPNHLVKGKPNNSLRDHVYCIGLNRLQHQSFPSEVTVAC